MMWDVRNEIHIERAQDGDMRRASVRSHDRGGLQEISARIVAAEGAMKRQTQTMVCRVTGARFYRTMTMWLESEGTGWDGPSA